MSGGTYRRAPPPPTENPPGPPGCSTAIGDAAAMDFGAASKTRTAGPQTASNLGAERSDFYPKLPFEEAQPCQRKIALPGAPDPAVAVYLLLCMFKRFALA